jgi:hypothetical protein
MLRHALAFLVVSLAGGGAAAQDMPLLRGVLERVIVIELSSHDSEQSAWFNESRKDKQKWTKGKIFGRPMKLASWTEESKSWIWLEEPDKTLSVKLERLAVNQGRAEFAAKARAKARFKVWGRIPKLAKGMAGGTVWLEMQIAGSAKLAGLSLADADIDTLQGTFSDLQFNNDLASVFEDLVEDSLNASIKRDNDKLRAKIERAINKVHL